PEYMSPEQCTGATVDHRSDIYALGCMLFEMIAGAPPFTSEHVRDLLTAHKFRPPPSLAAAAPDVPPCLHRFVGRMLGQHPAARPQTTVEVAGVLAVGGHVGDRP